MGTVDALTVLANEYGHRVTDLYEHTREGDKQFVSMRTTKGGVEFHIHADNYDGAVAEFKRQATCPFFPPAVGEGMSGGFGGDCYSYTVTKVTPSGSTITLREDTAKQTGDYFGNQKWEVTGQGVGREIVARWSEKRQRYVAKSGMRLTMGRRWAQDPSF